MNDWYSKEVRSGYVIKLWKAIQNLWELDMEYPLWCARGEKLINERLYKEMQVSTWLHQNLNNYQAEELIIFCGLFHESLKIIWMVSNTSYFPYDKTSKN